MRAPEISVTVRTLSVCGWFAAGRRRNGSGYGGDGPMFDLPAPIRKATYTTNIIESVNSVIRKFTRNRKQYPSRESAMKLIFMAIHEASKKWSMPIPKWKEALNHFAILFEDRMPKNS